MADFNSDQWAQRLSVAFPGEIGAAQDYNGRVRTAYAKFTGGVSTLAQNDRIRLFEIPGGARVVGVKTRHGAFGFSVTLAIGTTASAAKYLAATSIAAAGTINAVPATFTPESGNQPVTLYATLGGANPADDQDLEVLVEYVLT
jgi:hypothetical protein